MTSHRRSPAPRDCYFWIEKVKTDLYLSCSSPLSESFSPRLIEISFRQGREAGRFNSITCLPSGTLSSAGV